MKKISLLFSLLFAGILLSVNADATIWRVNNNGFTANFTSLQAANDDNNVVNGDTIHLEGSPVVYGGCNITKTLVIIGPGFFLTENPNTSNNFLEANIAYINFNTGSISSQFIGVYVSSSFGINVNVSGILVKRCRIDAKIYLSQETSDIRIVQNFFFGKQSSSLIQPSSFGFPANVVFNNNICQKTLILNDGYTLLQCNNNVFDCPTISGNPSIKLNAASFKNNILKTPNALVDINGGSGSNVTHNISATTVGQFGTANNNIIVANMSTLFVDAATHTTDGDYQLLPGSPGSNNGLDGSDRGAFGGSATTNRYMLSGLAPIPVIYEINTTGVAAPSGLPVSIKARVVN